MFMRFALRRWREHPLRWLAGRRSEPASPFVPLNRIPEHDMTIAVTVNQNQADEAPEQVIEQTLSFLLDAQRRARGEKSPPPL